MPEVFKYWTVVLCLCIFSKAYGQKKPENLNFSQFNIKGAFIEDSIQLGLSVFYALSINYPSETQIIFPDQKYSYGTFELIKKHFFETKSQNNRSLDSVLYELRTFEINEIQTLALPVFIIPREDTISYPIYPQKDSIVLKELVTQNLDHLKVRPQTSYQKVKSYFDYPFLIGVILFIALIS